MEIKREDVRKKIWSIADNLRNSIDGWDFKQYILGMMFYRYISETFRDRINKYQKDLGNEDFKFEDCNDQEAENYLKKKNKIGYFICPSELFQNLIKDVKENKIQNLSKKLGKILKKIQKSFKGGQDLSGLFSDIDLNSNKLGVDQEERDKRVQSLILGINNMPLHSESEGKYDAFGDAYEFLMAMYASNAGKSGGEFYTPPEVSELLARLAIEKRKKIKKVYDPACGSGSLLLKVAKILGQENIEKFYGQEINLTTSNLCRINMFLHNINYDKFDIKNSDTLLNPHENHKKEKFDVIVSNPPYSTKWEGDNNPKLIKDPRFAPAGVLAPKSKADMAFIMHSLYHLSNDGTAAIVCFPGIMYRGGKEQKIRKYLVDNNHVDCVISLAPNLFYGTQTPTCIMVLKKNKKDKNILFIDGTKEFIKVKNSNKLTEENIGNIFKAYEERKDKQYFCKLVTLKKVNEQKYNLSVDTYVEKEDNREEIDIKDLNAKIASTVQRINHLRNEIDQIVKEIESSSEE